MPKSQYFYLFLHCLIPNRIWSSLPSLHTKGAVNKSKTTVEWRVGEKRLHHNGTPPVSVQRVRFPLKPVHLILRKNLMLLCPLPYFIYLLLISTFSFWLFKVIYFLLYIYLNLQSTTSDTPCCSGCGFMVWTPGLFRSTVRWEETISTHLNIFHRSIICYYSSQAYY